MTGIQPGILPGSPSQTIDRDRYVAVSNEARPIALTSRPSRIPSYPDAPCRDGHHTTLF